jgi:hypothetical protein
MNIRTIAIFAGLIGALTAPALAQTSTQNSNNPAKPYVDVPGTNKAGSDSTGATGSVGGNTNTGGTNGTAAPAQPGMLQVGTLAMAMAQAAPAQAAVLAAVLAVAPAVISDSA